MPRQRVFTQEALAPIVAASVSVAEVCRRFGKSEDGGMHAYVSKRIREYKLDTSHFLGQRANSGPRHRGGRTVRPPMEILVLGHFEKRPALLKALLSIGCAYMCEVCLCPGEWRGRPLTLQIDHKDGDNLNNLRENLRFLCPNCHSQTATWSGRNSSRHGGSVAIVGRGDRL